MSITKEEVKKLSLFYRSLSAFILFCSVFAFAGLAFALITEPFDLLFIPISGVVLAMAYISWVITFTGYAPKYLLHTHGPDRNT